MPFEKLDTLNVSPIREEIAQYVDSALFADGFDEAILGFTEDGKIVYSEGRCIELLVLQGMDHDEALEYYHFNVVGAYVGDKTPIFITFMNDLR